MRPAEEVAREWLSQAGVGPDRAFFMLRSLIALIERERNPWQPIETAPQGEVLDVWVLPIGRRVPEAQWCKHLSRWCYRDGLPISPQPTHWMRVPPPPERT